MKTALRAMSVVVGAACASAPVATAADVLWHQPYDTSGTAVRTQEYPDFPSFSIYGVNDVTFDRPVIIDRITVYLYADSSWANVPEARLHIYRKFLTLPDRRHDPRNDSVVTLTGRTLEPSVVALTAENLNLHMSPGDWWIGFAPIADFATWGSSFTWLTDESLGDPSAVRNPGGGFGIGTEWVDFSMLPGGQPGDFAMTIEGRFATAPALLTDVTRTLGVHRAGGVLSARLSDDIYYTLQSGPGLDSAEPHSARADFGFRTDGFAASKLDVTLEEKANIGGPTAVLLLRNVATGKWDELDRFGLSTMDQIFSVADIPAGDYVDGDRIEVRVRTFAVLILNPQVRGIFSHDFVGVRMIE